MLRNPESHHGVVYRCGAWKVLFVVLRIAIVHFLLEKIQDQVSQKSPQRKAILARYNRFVETDCVSHREPGQGQSCVADETIENVLQTFFFRNPRKSTKRHSLELNIPKTTIWTILKKCSLWYISNETQLYKAYLFQENCSTCFGWYLHPSSGAHTCITVFTVSGTC